MYEKYLLCYLIPAKTLFNTWNHRLININDNHELCTWERIHDHYYICGQSIICIIWSYHHPFGFNYLLMILQHIYVQTNWTNYINSLRKDSAHTFVWEVIVDILLQLILDEQINHHFMFSQCISINQYLFKLILMRDNTINADHPDCLHFNSVNHEYAVWAYW